MIPQSTGGMLLLIEHCHLVEVRGDKLVPYRKDLSAGELERLPAAVCGALKAVAASLQEALRHGKIRLCGGNWPEWNLNMPEMTGELGCPSAELQLAVLSKVSSADRGDSSNK